MINLQLSYSDDMKEKKLAPGVTIANEGTVLVSTLVDGEEKVRPSTGANTDVVVGFAWSNSIVPGTMVVTDEKTIPAIAVAAASTIAIANGIAGSFHIVGSTTASWTLVANAAAVNAAGKFFYDESTGVLTVWNIEAGEDITVTYRKNLTVIEQQSLFGDPRPNLGAGDFFEQITVARGNGEIYTDQYDTSVDWSSATVAYTGANGLLTSANTSTIAVGRIISRPSASNKFLGIAFNLA